MKVTERSQLFVNRRVTALFANGSTLWWTLPGGDDKTWRRP